MFNFSKVDAPTGIYNLLKIKNKARMTDREIILKEIQEFKKSPRRKAMVNGERYYIGEHDILDRKRQAIGEAGVLEEITNIPNNRIVDNQYKKMVDQKVNYLLGQPITIQSDNVQYAKILKTIFNKKFQRLLKNLGEDSLNDGIGWLYPYYDEKGQFTFKRFNPYEVIPGWKDAEHTILEYAIRFYDVIVYEGKTEKVIQKVEVYHSKGINRFVLEGGMMLPDDRFFDYHFSMVNPDGTTQGFNWAKIPLIPFKYNNKEIPLIKMVKSLQDGLNLIISNFENNMEEDPRNTIMVIMNYDGENLGQFRKNLATYGAVKVKTVDGAAGDVKTLQVEVNAENYKVIIEVFKKAIIENAMGYDAKDDRLAGNPNQMNIQSMYSDIDLDANSMETEYQAAFEELLWFVNAHLFNAGYGDFEGEEVDIIFNRDMLISESEIIDNCSKSSGIISDETILANHPWIDDVEAEMERMKKQKEEEINQYGGFGQNNPLEKGGDGLNGEE